MFKRCFHCFLYLLLVVSPSFSQQPVFKAFSFKEGLNTYGIYKTLQDSYGFIWVATQDGLYRFNGASFEVLKAGNSFQKNLAGNFFLDICLTDSNKILTADFNKGIDIVNIVNLETTTIADYRDNELHPLPNLWLQKIHTDPRGNLWIGSNNYFAYKVHGQKDFVVVDKVKGFSKEINVLFIQSIGNKYVAISIEGYGIILYNMNTFRVENSITNIEKKTEITSYNAKDIIIDKDTTFILTDNGIIKGRFKGAQWEYIERFYPDNFRNYVAVTFVRDNENNFWIGTNSGLIKYNPYSHQLLSIKTNPENKRGLLDNSINHLMIDKENNLWISTSKILQMLSLNNNGIRYFSGDGIGSDPLDHVYTLVSKSNTEIYATATDGLYLVNLITGKSMRIKGTAKLGVVHHLEKIDNDFYIVFCDKGSWAYIPSQAVLSQNALIKRFPEWEPYKNMFFNNAYIRNNIYYWASEQQEGLLKWDRNEHSILQFKAGTPQSRGIPENHIHNLKADKEGNLWLMMDNSIAEFDIQKDSVLTVIKYNKKSAGPNSSFYFDMYDDGKELWFTTYGGGLNSYNKRNKEWKYITEKEGLSNNSTYCILPESDSVFWVSSNMGLSRVDYVKNTSINYYYEDGLQDNSFDEKSALKIDDRLYFGGINGFSEIDLSKYTERIDSIESLIFKIEYYLGDKKTVLYGLKWDKVILPSGVNTVNIYLAALTYANNHKIKFNYKIAGLNDVYIEAVEKNVITLNTLTYGSYRLDIGYRDYKGHFVEHALNLEIFVEPKWYQTWWFKLLVLLTSCGIIYAFYRYRIAQINKQHDIRKNIATDLHDDLGSTLNSVKVFTNLAISGVKQEENLQQVKDNLNEATMGLRDMIWVLDDTLDTVDELATRLKQYALPVTAASKIEMIIKADSEVNARQLSKQEKRNLFLICKEAINNSIKYSGANMIDVFITASGKKIRILLTDNGKGFNPEEVKKGYGLKNMQYRAGQIKYKVSLTSILTKGTSIEIKPA